MDKLKDTDMTKRKQNLQKAENRFIANSLIHKINNKKASTVKKTVINMLSPYRKNVYTITSDNGLEFAEHHTISNKLEADYFFCDPYSSWQRGLNEYTNKLYRQ